MDWEKEFDERFPHIVFPDRQNSISADAVLEMFVVLRVDLKQFITELLIKENSRYADSPLVTDTAEHPLSGDMVRGVAEGFYRIMVKAEQRIAELKGDTNE